MNVVSNERAPEREYSLEEEFAASFFNGSLNLILLPTEHCNFRCTYCYEDFSIGRMPPAVSEGVKHLIDRRLDSLLSLTISWFGGEPLLAYDIVENISAHIAQATRNRPELNYQGDMTTNGYLLDAPVIERLAELGIRSFQISLDGPQPLHDKTRLRANGKNSFDKIWENLLTIRRSSIDVKVLLRIHLTPENVVVMPDFLRQIREAFLCDPRFKVLLKPIERMGGVNNDIINVISEDDRPATLATLHEIVRGGGDANALFSGDQVCYAARANSLMIRADGRVGKCTVALSDPVNTIGRLLSDGSLQINNAVLHAWLRGWETGDRSFLRCPYASIPHDQPELLQIQLPTRV